MRTANSASRRPLTNRMAIAAILALGLLAGCVPTAAQAVEVPTASASAAETKAESVTVGNGLLISLDEQATTYMQEGKDVVGSLAIGERARWTSIDDRPSPKQYFMTDERGDAVRVSEMDIFAFPQEGIEITPDRPLIIKSPAGKNDTTSAMGGKLDLDALTIRSAPSPKAPILSTLRVGQKFVQSSTTVDGHSSLFGSSRWAIVLIPSSTPDAAQFGFIRSEATAIDPSPHESEALEAAPTLDADDPGAPIQPSPEETAPVSEDAIVQTTEPAPAEEPLTEATDSNLGTMFLVGAGGLVTGILLGAGLATALRKKTDNEPGDKADNAPTKHTETVADEVAGDEDADETPATETDDAEDIDWEAEEV